MPATSRPALPSRRSLATLSAIMLMPCLSLLAAEPPSKPFLDKNSFYLSSAGFKVHFANDAAGKKALHALPPHRFVIHNLGGGDVRYLYAEPQHCVSSAPGMLIKAIVTFSPSQYRSQTMSPRITRRRLARCWRATPSICWAPPLCRRVFPQLLLGGLI